MTELTISYSQCLADPTYCDTGVSGGAQLMKRMGVKANEARPIKDILPFITLAEALWLLRAVKTSQKEAADKVAWGFICRIVSPTHLCAKEVIYYIEKLGRINQSKLTLMQEYYTDMSARYIDPLHIKQNNLALAILTENSPSQKAVNVSKLAIDIYSFGGKAIAEEDRQRILLEELL